ncbi:NADH:ubiquinone reductase (Na(+)-transporting) subunit B [PVC group bacterium (ex Bugula neritina AB1)]|nr:NADH:ubiquinone reductase (Na(+)-transporting) subunit B [PVC group bacterium (ex Bugula neritina AB1)]
MKFLEKKLDKIGKLFKKGSKFEFLYPLFEAADTFLLSPARKARKAPFVRDSVDLKRTMSIVVMALTPCILVAMYNTGFQMLKYSGQSPDILPSFLTGALQILPIIFVSYAVGGLVETVFALVRKHEINEGFLVTGMLYPLTLPPNIPLWQVAVGILFGVLIGKEVFGGTGMNILNPALTARVFLFFSYPGNMSGDSAWLAVDGISKATPLSVIANASAGQTPLEALSQAGYSWIDMFLGLIPGSIGETSTLACLMGAFLLIMFGVGSFRIMLSCFLGVVFMSFILLCCKSSSPMLMIPPHMHCVMGGFAFGSIFMATDPVSASATPLGRWIYGFLTGVLIVLIRAVNPAYPEGVMLAILFMNVFAPLIDHYVVKANISRRLKRA